MTRPRCATLLSLLFAATACDVIDLGPDNPSLETIADFSVPTDDGLAAYRFHFSRVPDGPLVTEVETPIGYPEVRVDGECALDTFLKVAPSEMEVPRALLETCGVPVDGAEPRTLRADDPTFTAADLGGTGVLAADGPTRSCSPIDFNKRVEELEVLAGFDGLILSCEEVCEEWLVWDTFGSCELLDGQGHFIDYCDPGFYPQTEEKPEGIECLQHSGYECGWHWNPDCHHDYWVLGDVGPMTKWTRVSSGASRISGALAEITNCDADRMRGYWQSQGDGLPWSSEQNFAVAGAATKTIVLSAGTDSYGRWRGWDFRFHAEGDGFRAVSAWVALQGKDAEDCPIVLDGF